MSDIQFSKIQQEVIDARGTNLLVSASAGSGKTAVLVERLCQMVIKDKISVSSILAMTFTEDAAAEMKTRLKNRLKEEDETDPWIHQQLVLLETASISTIHSFCLSLVQTYYYLIGISYTRANTVETGLKDDQALEAAYQKALADLPAVQSARMRLYLQAYGKNDQDLQRSILKFIETAHSKPDPQGWMDQARKENPASEAWFYNWFEIRIQALSEIFERVLDEVKMMSFPKANKQDEYIVLFENKIALLEQCMDWLKKREYAKFGHTFVEYIETTGKFTPTINKVKFTQEQKESRELEKEIGDALFSMEEYDRFQSEIQDLQSLFVDLALKTGQYFEQIKNEQEFLDFSDMEQMAWKLLNIDSVRQSLKNKYEVILVDEYQDTNDLQESIIRSFARDNNVFRVGDVKQSIYGFRQARVGIMKDLMEHPGPNDRVLHMQDNYRSNETIIRFNNEFYNKLMNVSPLPSQFGKADIAFCPTEKQKQQPQVPVRFLYTCYGQMKDPNNEEAKFASYLSLHKKHRYDMIAADIEQQVKEGKARYRDIAILSRSSTHHEELKQALESWGIRSVHHVKKGFYTNKSVQIVLSALKVIADKRNDIALMAMLCSPLTGLDQKDLIPLALHRQEGESLYQTLRNTEGSRKALKTVWDMEAWKTLSVAEILEKIYNYNSFYNNSTTSQDKTNLDLLMEKASQAGRSVDLEEFLSSTQLEESLNKTSEAIPFGKEEDAVKIGTIHASKGLQYKVVYILSEENNRDMDKSNPITFDADLGLAFQGLSPDMMVKTTTRASLAFEHKRFIEDQQEKMRLLYVASTRAQEQLIFVDSIRDEEQYNWPLDLRVLLNNKGFTSWFFHAFYNTDNPLVCFDKKESLYDRPDKGILKNYTVRLPQYKKPVQQVFSQTASAAKSNAHWPALKAGAGSVHGKERGTLFHEMAENLPYPFVRKEAAAYASKAGLELSGSDLDQFLSLNDNGTYQDWMKKDHQFECPYSVFDNGALIHGYMDLVVHDGDEIHILDFKSDNAFDMESLKNRYRQQLDTYKRAMELIEPGKKVTAWIYSFSLKELAAL